MGAGVFIVLEGGDAVGKSTQAGLLATWLRQHGREVVLTFEPGDTPVGAILREILLSPSTGELSARAEALIYAADKAQHVHQVVLPALRRGAVVISDRYVDSMLAYQGAGRDLPVQRLEQIGRWATHDLLPDLTVVLDLDPRQGVGGIEDPDRLEGAGEDLHQRARQAFLDLAAEDPQHYLVLAARSDIDDIATAIRQRVTRLLSATTGTLGA